MIGNEAFMTLHKGLNAKNAPSNDRPAAELDRSIVQEKLNKLADVLEKHLRQTTSRESIAGIAFVNG